MSHHHLFFFDRRPQVPLISKSQQGDPLNQSEELGGECSTWLDRNKDLRHIFKVAHQELHYHHPLREDPVPVKPCLRSSPFGTIRQLLAKQITSKTV